VYASSSSSLNKTILMKSILQINFVNGETNWVGDID
jgi:hypothetical protein